MTSNFDNLISKSDIPSVTQRLVSVMIDLIVIMIIAQIIVTIFGFGGEDRDELRLYIQQNRLRYQEVIQTYMNSSEGKFVNLESLSEEDKRMAEMMLNQALMSTIFSFVLWLLYYTITSAHFGHSLGMYICNFSLVNKNSLSKLSYTHSLLRYALWMISAVLLLGIPIVIFYLTSNTAVLLLGIPIVISYLTLNKRGFCDKLTSSVLVLRSNLNE